VISVILKARDAEILTKIKPFRAENYLKLFPFISVLRFSAASPTRKAKSTAGRDQSLYEVMTKLVK